MFRFPLALLILAASEPGSPFPRDEACAFIGAPSAPLPYVQGEALEFEIDALGIRAGTMTMRLLPPRTDGAWAVEIYAKSNAFFTKIRQIASTIVTRFSPLRLRPIHSRETTSENWKTRYVEATYGKPHVAALRITDDTGRESTRELTYGNDVSDLALGVYMLRAIPLTIGQPLCADVVADRRLWRVWGSVLEKEEIEVPAGIFEAFHIKGMAARHDLQSKQREVHLWIGTDAQRTPIAAMAVIDLGTASASLLHAYDPRQPRRVRESVESAP